MSLDEPSLKVALKKVADGRIRLPDFQRGWVWDDDRIASILATVTLNYPMGVVMALKAGGVGGTFKVRALEGVQDPDSEVELLLLDGQQRMTSLFQALYSDRPVETQDQRKNPIKRWYYVHIDRAIEGDREEAIISVPEDRKLRSDFGRRVDLDLSTRELEISQGYFPLNLAFDDERRDNWMFDFTERGRENKLRWSHFNTHVLKNLDAVDIPMIVLDSDTPKVAVCTVFEKVNTGGVTLNVFELLTATFAGDDSYSAEHGGDDFHLPQHWQETAEELAAAHPVLSGLENTAFLQALCLVSSYNSTKAASCKRKDMLDLDLETYLKWAPVITDALHWAGGFLHDQCVFRAQDLPYTIQLPALAAIRSVLGGETDRPEAREKLAQWYWCGVFGEQYGGTPDSRLPRDLEQVVAWIRGGRTPESVQEARFVESRLLTMQTRNSAAYKGVFALLLQESATDWFYSDKPISAEAIEDYKIDIYPVFPKAWCDKQGIDSQRQKSVVNKTLLSHRASRAVFSRPPSSALKGLERDSGIQPNWLDDAVRSHFIDADALRADDFTTFFAHRTAELLSLIERAMGQKAVREEVAG